MFIGLENIRTLFPEAESQVSVNAPDYCLTSFDYLKRTTAPLSAHVLYIAKSPADLKGLALIESMNLLIFNEEKRDLDKILSKYPVEVNYLEVATAYTDDVFTMLREYFNTNVATGLMAQTILNILFYETGIQSLVDSFTRAFNNPVFVFDAGYHLIACNYEMAKADPTGKEIVDNMGFTEKEFRLINQENHIHEKVKKSDKPLRVRHKEQGFEQLICAIDTRKDLGHIVINAVNRPFNDTDIELMTMLKEGIYQQMRKEEFINDNSGYPYEYFLKDLLDGKIATPKRYQKRLSYVNTTFSDNMYCLVVETARSSITLNTFLIRNRLESLFPDTKTLMYNGEIIVLFCPPKHAELTKKDYEKIRKLCTESEIFAGISNNFTDLMDFADYYKQALRAIEIGITDNQEPGLYVYRDYFMHHIANIFFQKESEKTYCHPLMEKLLKYDAENETDLSDTLYAYLICERNISAASDYLYIHRNTMTYRLKKIDSLVNINYDDPKERQYLILSYEMHKINKG
ncbi:MAG: helix-turn-helix domain-containing protein [Lachnospiraceae bacterium]|nr:helix-turn-helix domain-containing protein [Lachnospiraceae bacterium]MBR3360174.1 helix-turn-helix domain-containing protein [Lachnospiraceae bacterium]